MFNIKKENILQLKLQVISSHIMWMELIINCLSHLKWRSGQVHYAPRDPDYAQDHGVYVLEENKKNTIRLKINLVHKNPSDHTYQLSVFLASAK